MTKNTAGTKKGEEAHSRPKPDRWKLVGNWPDVLKPLGEEKPPEG